MLHRSSASIITFILFIYLFIYLLDRIDFPELRSIECNLLKEITESAAGQVVFGVISIQVPFFHTVKLSCYTKYVLIITGTRGKKKKKNLASLSH